MRLLLSFLTSLVLFLGANSLPDYIDQILSQNGIKPDEYKIAGPVKIIRKDRYVRFYIYPKEYKLDISKIKIIGGIPNKKRFKGYLFIKKDNPDKIIIIPVGDVEDEKAES